MGDIQYWQDQLTNEIESIRSIFSSLPRISDDMERKGLLDQAEKKLKNAAGSKRSFKMEIRILDRSERQTYEAELANHEQNLAELTEELKGYRSENTRNQLFLGANTDADRDSAQTDGDKMLADADRLQDKTAEALANTQNLIEDSKMVGMQTLEDLEAQREQITNIDNDVMRLEDNLNRADKLLKNFGKRMATDKVIQCFACTNVLLLVGVIAYVIFGKVTNDGKDDGSPADIVY